jgi:Mn-dependent DtxR family transcriptional regulator
MVASTSGVLLTIAIILSPKSGLLWKWIEQRALSRRILAEDILALFYRHAETNATSESTGTTDTTRSADAAWLANKTTLATATIANKLQRSSAAVVQALEDLCAKRWVTPQNSYWNLTEEGLRQAQNLVRTHRLWEHVLYQETNLSDRRLHANAESLEHFTSEELRENLSQRAGNSTRDPHGKQIPPDAS